MVKEVSEEVFLGLSFHVRFIFGPKRPGNVQRDMIFMNLDNCKLHKL